MPTTGTRSAIAIAFARGDADPHAGEQAGADVDTDRGDLVGGDSRVAAHELDGRHERLGVAPALHDLDHPQHAVVAGRARR